MTKNPKIDVEFERSVADEPKQTPDRDALDRDRHYGGDPVLDTNVEVDAEREKAEWEKRYGTEESRDRIGFNPNDETT